MTDDITSPEETMPDAPTLRATLASISHLEAFEDALRRRTEGLTWMVWGLVFAGLTMSYHAGSLADPPTGEPRPWTLLFPWLPWMLAGGIVTAAIWRSAALHAAALARPWWATLGGLVAVGAGIVGIFLASWLLPAALQAAVTPLTLFGLAALLVVATPLLRLSRDGRRIATAAALVQIAAGVAMGLAGFSGDALGYTMTAAVVAGTWIGAGLWETLRG